MADKHQSESKEDADNSNLIQLLFYDSDGEDFEGFHMEDINDCEIRRTVRMEQFYNDREFCSDTEMGWSRDDDGTLTAPFTGRSGINAVLPEQPTPLDFFYLLFDYNMWYVLVNETNRYAESKLSGNLKPSSRMNAWKDVTVDEMKTFIALIIATGLVKKDDIEMYWTTDETTETPFFGKIMSKNRFLSILSNLHLTNNEENTSNDPLSKVRPFLMMLSSFKDVYSPERDLSFDEATCPFKGRVGFKVYNPLKPHKFGIKLYQVCEASSGYCINFRIYQGRGAENETMAELTNCPNDLTLTSKTVLGLLACSGLLNTGHHVYVDNYYTSPELFEELDLNDTYACGTVRVNRRNMPEVFQKGNVKLGLQDGIFRRKGNLLALKYHDKRDIHMLSTIHGAHLGVTGKTDVNGSPIVKPVCIIDYVQKMRGVDTSDQLVQYYECFRKTVKWWRKLMFHLLNLLICNAFILYKKHGASTSKRSHQVFRSELVRLLIQSATEAPRPQKKGRKTEAIDRLRARHFPAWNKAKEGAKRSKPVRDCFVCNESVKNREGFKRKQTAFCCEPCGVSLCVPVCFELYHTKADYKRAYHEMHPTTTEE